MSYSRFAYFRSALLVTTLGFVLAACGGAAVDDLGASLTTVTTQDTTTSTTLTTTTTSEAPQDDPAGDFDAQAIVDAHFDAINAFDAEGAIAVFVAGATFSNSFYGDYPREDIDQDIVWHAAQGSIYVDPECAEDDSEEQPDDAFVTIVCETANLDAPSMAVGGPPVPVVMTIVVSADGIESIHYRYGTPDFRHVTNPFEAWVGVHHPEDSPNVGHFNWTTTEGARRNGLLTAEYAAAWAEYLEANGCTFLDGC